MGSTYSVSSYPDSSPSEQLAREVAAAKVLAMVEGSEVQGLPTAGAARALQALADLVAEHEAGLWASIVPHMYRCHVYSYCPYETTKEYFVKITMLSNECFYLF